jgi:hypothetical protein
MSFRGKVYVPKSSKVLKTQGFQVSVIKGAIKGVIKFLIKLSIKVQNFKPGKVYVLFAEKSMVVRPHRIRHPTLFHGKGIDLKFCNPLQINAFHPP